MACNSPSSGGGPCGEPGGLISTISRVSAIANTASVKPSNRDRPRSAPCVSAIADSSGQCSKFGAAGWFQQGVFASEHWRPYAGVTEGSLGKRHEMDRAAHRGSLVCRTGDTASQRYPDRPVRIVLPFGAGGVADVSSRIIADKLGERLGQRFVIENMPGAGGIAAAKAVLAAPPDGYTLGLVTNGTAISAAIFNKLPFDPVTEFDMISTLGTFDLVFAVSADSPYKTLA